MQLTIIVLISSLTDCQLEDSSFKKPAKEG